MSSASSRCRRTRRRRPSTCTVPPSCARTSCSSRPTTSRASVTCGSPSCATATSWAAAVRSSRCSSVTGALTITDPAMTRFNISLRDGVDMVLWAIDNCWGGEILVPKIPSYRIVDVATAVAPECEQRVMGVRPGEKLHEEMITASDSFNTVDLGRYFAILPYSAHYSSAEYCERTGSVPVPQGFAYNSGTNPD